MKMRFKNEHNKNLPYQDILFYTASAIVYALIFCKVYGIHVLNPTYVDWLMTGDRDLTQHYLGWLSFRNSPWMFPIGMTTELTYPFKTSVIFTDSIPLFAVLFKTFRFLLPKPFQYFGIWGLLCFILQGVISEKILKQFLNSKIQIFIASLLFVISPIMLRKMFIHTALAAHWLLLLGLYAFIKEFSIKKQCILWTLIAVLSSSTHIFFVAMNGFIIAGLTLKMLLNNKPEKKDFYPIILYLTSSVVTIALLGGFSNETSQAAAEGWGISNMNLNAFFNPLGWSYFLKPLPKMSPSQEVGFAYLGLGTLFLIFATLSHTLSALTVKKIACTWKIWVPFLFVFAEAFCFAITNNITFNDKIVCHIPLSPIIEKYLSTFRASGRFSWICVYMLMIYSTKRLSLISQKTIQVGLLFLALLVHLCDLHPSLKYFNDTFNQIKTYQNEIAENDILNEIVSDEAISNVYIASDVIRNDLFAIASVTLKNKKKLNRFYISHGKDDLFNKKFDEIIQEPKESDLYIFRTREEPRASFYNLHFYLAGDYLLGTVKALPNRDEYEISRNDSSEISSEIDALFF